jgi:membrane protease YdiL (CAAX protease family)
MPANVSEPLPAATDTDDRLAASLRGFGPLGLLAIVVVLSGNAVFVPLSAILALVWARLARVSLHELGFVWPQRWVRTILGGVVFGVALKLFMKSVVMPLFGADPVNQAFRYLAGNTAALPWVLYAVTVGAGFGEETIFRGFAFERLRRLLGTSAAATVVIVAFTAVWFGAEHYSLQGLAGVQQATVVGLVFGAVFATTRRLPMLIVAHAAFDVTAVALIYWELETAVARAFFR